MDEPTATTADAGDPKAEPVEVTLARVVRLGFDGDRSRFEAFLSALREVTPPGVEVILRGSAVTGTRWADGAPFDADGPGTSDLDVTFIGGDMLKFWETFYIPGLHTAPLNDEHPEVSPTMIPLRRALCALARRPVNMQATSSLVQFARDVIMDQPYVTLIGKEEGTNALDEARDDESAGDPAG
jgi:hypothetical protein